MERKAEIKLKMVSSVVVALCMVLIVFNVQGVDASLTTSMTVGDIGNKHRISQLGIGASARRRRLQKATTRVAEADDATKRQGPFSWFTSSWGSCSAECGTAKQVRKEKRGKKKKQKKKKKKKKKKVVVCLLPVFLVSLCLACRNPKSMG